MLLAAGSTMMVFSTATSRSSTSNSSRQVYSPCASVSSATVGVRSRPFERKERKEFVSLNRRIMFGSMIFFSRFYVQRAAPALSIFRNGYKGHPWQRPRHCDKSRCNGPKTCQNQQMKELGGQLLAVARCLLLLLKPSSRPVDAPQRASLIMFSTRTQLCGLFAALTHLRLVIEYFHIFPNKKRLMSSLLRQKGCSCSGS
jgi:hypothetical protein